MSETDLQRLLDLIRFDDPAHVAMLSDKLIDMGREQEAELLRSMHNLPRKDWRKVTLDISRDALLYYADDLTRELIRAGHLPQYVQQLPDRLADHIDDHIFEDTRWNRIFNTQEAAEILSQLSDHLETDSGLWDRQEPEEALSSQAGWTMRNAANHWADHILQEISEETQALLDDLAEAEDADDMPEVARLRDEVCACVEKLIKEYK